MLIIGHRALSVSAIAIINLSLLQCAICLGLHYSKPKGEPVTRQLPQTMLPLHSGCAAKLAKLCRCAVPYTWPYTDAPLTSPHAPSTILHRQAMMCILLHSSVGADALSVGIVGGGPSGASFAGRLREAFGSAAEITVFEAKRIWTCERARGSHGPRLRGGNRMEGPVAGSDKHTGHRKRPSCVIRLYHRICYIFVPL